MNAMVMNFVPIMTPLSWDQACWWPGSLWQLCSRVAIMGQHSTPQMPLRGCQKSVCTLKQLFHKLYPEILFILVNMAVGSAVVLNTFCILGQYWRNCDQSMGHSPPWLTAHSHLLVSLSSLFSLKQTQSPILSRKVETRHSLRRDRNGC